MNKSQKVAFLGAMTALGMILSYVDSMIPILPSIPGVRLGIANSVGVFLLYYAGARTALAVTVVRVVLSGVLFYGNVYHIAYGLSGALVAFLCMYALKRSARFSVTGVSIGGGVAHNIGQIACVALFTRTPEIVSYLPVLLVVGCVCGMCIGILSAVIMKRFGVKI